MNWQTARAVSLPLLISSFFTLYFYFRNFMELSALGMISTLAGILAANLLMLGVVFAVTKEINCASLLCFFFLMGFFSHEKLVYTTFLLHERPTHIPLPGTYDIPASLYYIVFGMMAGTTCLLAFILVRFKRPLYGFVYFFWRFSAAAVMITLISGYWTISHISKPILPLPHANRTDQKPDIYVIVLDAYGRSDVLQKYYNLDTEPFVRFLTGQGFKVFTDSRANYQMTSFSVGSELNFSYLDAASIPGLGRSYYPLTHLRETNRVSRFLKDQGYQIVNIWGGGDFGKPFSNTDLSLGSIHGVNEFYTQFLKNTYMGSVFPSWWLHVVDLDGRRNATLQALQHLRELPAKLRHPSFVMVHIICPHEPFFLNEEGGRPYADRSFDWNGKRNFGAAYGGQANYLARQMEIIVPELLKNSLQPPVILIHGDHGPPPQAEDLPTQVAQRYPNLCALYLPGGDYREFPEDIVPVNYFRYIFNRYFDTRLEILPQHSYVIKNGGRNIMFEYEEVTQYIGHNPASAGKQGYLPRTQ